MVTVVSLAEADELHNEFDVVISAGPRPSEVRWGHPRHLVRTFYDVTDLAARGAVTQADVTAMLTFAQPNQSVLVHCHRGESRSTAVAIGLLVQAGNTPTAAVERLRSAHPHGRQFIPNPLVLGYVEQVLGCLGLVAAVAKVVPTAGALLPTSTTRQW
jgi:predicted protein tyrosine phosphatase